MIYRNVLGQLRRAHWEAPWRMTGVVIDGDWSAAADGISPAPVRAIEAGNVIVVALTVHRGGRRGGVAVDVALLEGYVVSDDEPGGPRWYNIEASV